MLETFRIIEGFPDYQVSNWGSIKSMKFNREKILKPFIDTYGYQFVCLSENSKQYVRTIHKLVTDAWMGKNPFIFPVIRHLDGDKLNNHIGNLKRISKRKSLSDSKRKTNNLITA